MFLKKSLKLSLYIHVTFYYEVKQTKTNLQKYFSHSALNYLIHAHVLRVKIRSAKGSNLKEDDRALALWELLLYMYSLTNMRYSPSLFSVA